MAREVGRVEWEMEGGFVGEGWGDWVGIVSREIWRCGREDFRGRDGGCGGGVGREERRMGSGDGE